MINRFVYARGVSRISFRATATTPPRSANGILHLMSNRGLPVRLIAGRLLLASIIFRGFLGGESGQFDPVLAENNSIIGVPTKKDCYLNDAMVEHAVTWIRDQKAQSPDKPFFLYFSTGATHAPHQVPKGWSDKYKGKFDQAWDKLREETFARQKQLGVIPASAGLTPRDPAFPVSDSITPEIKQLHSHQMEVYAGYQENADHTVGRVVQAIDELGLAEQHANYLYL
jgi:arylsulfatase